MTLNTTDLNNSSLKDGSDFQNFWVISQTLTAIVYLGSIWFICSLIYYGKVTNKWKKDKLGQYKSLWMMSLAVGSPTAAIMRALCTQVVLIVGESNNYFKDGDYACEISMDVSIILYGVALAPTYFFLWYRQKMLYTEPVMKHLNTKLVKVLSSCFVALSVAASLSCTIIATYPKSYILLETGCCLKDDATSFLANYLAGGALVLSQVILFGLFINVLLSQVKRTNLMKNQTSSKKEKTKKAILLAVKKAAISMVICSASDILALVIVSTVLPRQTPRCLTNAVYDLGLFFNSMSVMICLVDIKSFICGTKNLNSASKRSKSIEMTSFACP